MMAETSKRRQKRPVYAVVEHGGKQYKVKEGDVVRVEKVDLKPGKKIEFKDVLLVSDEDGLKVGNPHVKRVKVVGKLVQNEKDKKIIVFKMKRRKNYRSLCKRCKKDTSGNR